MAKFLVKVSVADEALCDLALVEMDVAAAKRLLRCKAAAVEARRRDDGFKEMSYWASHALFFRKPMEGDLFEDVLAHAVGEAMDREDWVRVADDLEVPEDLVVHDDCQTVLVGAMGNGFVWRAYLGGDNRQALTHELPLEAVRRVGEPQDPQVHRPGAWREPCEFCAQVECDYDCDESQAGGFQ